MVQVIFTADKNKVHFSINLIIFSTFEGVGRKLLVQVIFLPSTRRRFNRVEEVGQLSVLFFGLVLCNRVCHFILLSRSCNVITGDSYCWLFILLVIYTIFILLFILLLLYILLVIHNYMRQNEQY